MVIVLNEAINCVSKEGFFFFLFFFYFFFLFIYLKKKLKSYKTRGRKAEQIMDS